MVAKISQSRKRKVAPWRRALLYGIVAVCFALGIGFLVLVNIRIYKKRAELAAQAKMLQEQKDKLLDRTRTLRQDMDESAREWYQEKVLRENGLYKKQGEEVVTVIPPAQNAAPAQQAPVPLRKNWWDPLSW